MVYNFVVVEIIIMREMSRFDKCGGNWTCIW